MSKRALAALLVLLGASPAHAQRYRVVVGGAGTSVRSVIEFRPCIPAEGSDCGAWVDHTTDATTDGGASAPEILQQAVTPNGRFSVSIRAGSVAITSLARPDSGRTAVAKGLHGAATAIVVSGDSQYAFAVTSASGSVPAEVCMIDLEWRSVIARLSLNVQPVGISTAR